VEVVEKPPETSTSPPAPEDEPAPTNTLPARPVALLPDPRLTLPLKEEVEEPEPTNTLPEALETLAPVWRCSAPLAEQRVLSIFAQLASALFYVHSKGLLFGIYADVGSATCGGYSGLGREFAAGHAGMSLGIHQDRGLMQTVGQAGG
jgi:hypothetical protein